MADFEGTDIDGIRINTNPIPDIRSQLITTILAPIDGRTGLTRHKVLFIVSEHLVVVNQNIIARSAHVIDAKDLPVIDNDVVAHLHLIVILLVYRHIARERHKLKGTNIDGIL